MADNDPDTAEHRLSMSTTRGSALVMVSVIDIDTVLRELTELRRLWGQTPCAWTQDADGDWQTGCGHLFERYVNGPKANNYAYCPYCGAALREA